MVSDAEQNGSKRETRLLPDYTTDLRKKSFIVRSLYLFV